MRSRRCSEEADRSLRACRPRQHRRFQQPLQIDRGGVTHPAEIPRVASVRAGRRVFTTMRLSMPGTISSRATYRGSTSQSIRASGKRLRNAANVGIAWITSPIDLETDEQKSMVHRDASAMRQQIAGRVILGIPDDGDAPAVGADDVAFEYRIERVVGPLAMHVGSNRLEQRAHGFRKDDDQVDEPQRGDQLRPIRRRQDRPPFSFSALTEGSSLIATISRSPVPQRQGSGRGQRAADRSSRWQRRSSDRRGAHRRRVSRSARDNLTHF